MAGVATAADAVQWRSNAEYGLTVAFPPKTHPFVTGSWRHAHGWGISLSGTGKGQRAIGVQGDYNAADSMTPEEATGCSDPYLSEGAKLRLSFPHYQSATCREDHAEGFILITVLAQAGETQSGNPEHPTVPSINYQATLTTTPVRMTEDLITFRGVLASVRIHPETVTGPKPPFGF